MWPDHSTTVEAIPARHKTPTPIPRSLVHSLVRMYFLNSNIDIFGYSRGCYLSADSERIVQLVREKPETVALPTEEHVTVHSMHSVVWTGDLLAKDELVCVMRGCVMADAGTEPTDDVHGLVYWLGERIICNELYTVNLVANEMPPFCRAQMLRQTASAVESNCYLATFNGSDGTCEVS